MCPGSQVPGTRNAQERLYRPPPPSPQGSEPIVSEIRDPRPSLSNVDIRYCSCATYILPRLFRMPSIVLGGRALDPEVVDSRVVEKAWYCFMMPLEYSTHSLKERLHRSLLDSPYYWTHGWDASIGRASNTPSLTVLGL